MAMSKQEIEMRERLAKRQERPGDVKAYSLDEMRALQNKGYAPVGVKYRTVLSAQALLMGGKGKVTNEIEYHIMRAGV